MARRKRSQKLSTRLLLACVAVVAVCLGLVAPSLGVMLRQNYIARAAGTFEQDVSRSTDELRGAAERSDPRALDAICERLNAGFDGRVSLIAADGRILADSMKAQCAAVARPECVARIMADREHAHEQDGPLANTVAVRLPVNLGARGMATIRLALPLAPVQMQMRQILNLLLLSGAAAAVIGLVIGLVLSRRIARPVEQMTDMAERIAAGDFSGRVTCASRDEIGRLAEALESMRASLEGNLQQIRRERNQALAIVANMSDGVLAVAATGEVLLANAAAAAMLGQAKTPEPGTAVTGLSLPVALRNALATVTADGGAVEIEMGDVAAGERVVHVSLSAVSGADGAGSRGVVLVLRDMTAARRAESMGRDLVANASHELRTPLTMVASAVDTLLHAPPSDTARQREFLDIIARQSQRMERLVGETLQLSQLDAGAVPGRWESLAVADLVREVAEAYAPLAASHGVRLDVSSGEELPPVLGVESLLLRALGNLVDNAIRYTPRGGVVTVSASPLEKGTQISVRDTGPGIPPAEQARIFDRFVRGRLGQAAGDDGAGLGLAIVRRVVALHHGRLDLESAPGQGSCFRVYLDACRETGGQPPPDVSSAT